jgi:hypothetical protein
MVLRNGLRGKMNLAKLVSELRENQQLILVIFMKSIWICCDAQSDGPKRSRMITSRSSPCFGVFTDEPVNIARRLPRPVTPFVPAPETAVGYSQRYPDPYDSAPADLGFDFGNQSPEPGCGLDFF